MLEKWDVVRVYCSFLPNPHDKFCICICPDTYRFFFINSEPPFGRKARDVVVSVENFEAGFLNHTSYVDTTKLLTINNELVDAAFGEAARQHGKLAPFLRTRIVEMAAYHGALEPADEELVCG